MIHVFFAGTLLGIILSITLGPAFFSIIQTSIDRGFKSAFYIAVGISLSDLALIGLSFLGVSHIIHIGNNQEIFGIVGGTILIMFGVYTFFKKPEMLKRRLGGKFKISNPNIATFIGKGFLLNIANPFLWIFWISAMSGLSQQVAPELLNAYMITFFSGTVITVFSLDILKSYVGLKIKKYLSIRKQLYMNRIVGISLVIFGIVLIVRLFLI
jgi:threonine/homoserine/homoserine lactone efflux protein